MHGRNHSEQLSNREFPPLISTSRPSSKSELKNGFYSMSTRKHTESSEVPSRKFPGVYSYKWISNGPAVEFQKTPRFSDRNVDTELHQILSKRQSSLQTIVQTNRICVSDYPNVKKFRISSLIQTTNKRTKNTQKKKIQIETERKNKLLLQYQRKQRKFEITIRKKEAIIIKKSWAIFVSIFGAMFVSKKLIENRKRLRKRTVKILLWLQVVSRAVGKFQLKLKKHREKRAKALIRFYMLGYIKIWMMKRRKMYSRAIIDVIESARASDILFRLMAKWEFSLLYLQRTLRSLLSIKKKQNEKMIKIWNEKEFLKKCNATSNRLKSKIYIRKFRNMIPDTIKLFYMRQLIYKALRNYSFSLKNCSEILQKPLKPRLETILTCEELKDVIKMAYKQRSKWGEILKIQNKALAISYQETVYFNS